MRCWALELWDVGLSLCSTEVLRGRLWRDMLLFCPFLYQFNHSLSFARMEVSKSETGPCSPVSLSTSNPKVQSL